MPGRFITYVDGSNLYGTLRKLNLKVQDFGGLYRYVFEVAAERWRSTWHPSTQQAAQHVRVYWYVVARMDDWDLSNPRTVDFLRDRFQHDRDLRRLWMAAASRKFAGTRLGPNDVESEAWAMWFNDFKAWYDAKCRTLEGMLRFYHGVESSTEFIEFRRCGRWKVNASKSLTEKGVDTSFAVDMVGMVNNFDVALLISDDADSIPSLRYIKEMGKQVGVVEFARGEAPETWTRGASTHVKQAADFVAQVYEAELIKRGLAARGDFQDEYDDDPIDMDE